MSDRISGLVVTFDEDISEEAGEEIRKLLLWVRGVVSVRPITANIDQLVAASRNDNEWRTKLLELLKGKS